MEQMDKRLNWRSSSCLCPDALITSPTPMVSSNDARRGFSSLSRPISVAPFVEPIDREVICKSNDTATASRVWNKLVHEQSSTTKQEAPQLKEPFNAGNQHK
jgi:hypothetical protein